LDSPANQFCGREGAGDRHDSFFEIYEGTEKTIKQPPSDVLFQVL